MNKKISPYFIGTLWFLFFLVVFKILVVRIYNPDVWWHLSAGRAIVEGRQFLKEDIFSHTRLGQGWVNFEWFAQVLGYLLCEWLGMGGLFYAKVILGLLAVVFLSLSLREVGARGPWALLLSYVGFLLVRPRLMEKPELITLVLMPLFLLLILRARSSPPKKRRWLLWAQFPLMVLWVNSHGGWVYGLGMLVLFGVGARWQGKEKRFVRFLDGSIVLAFLAAAMNPHGIFLIKVILEHLRQLGGGPRLIQEWQSPGIEEALLFWMGGGLAVSLLLIGFYKKWDGVKFWMPVILLFSLWSMTSVRNVALCGFLLGPFLVDVLGPRLTITSCHKNFKPLLTVGWILCASIPVLQAKKLIKPFPQGYVKWRRYPRGACAYVKKKNITGHMYNTYGYGGYITWALGPRRKVFFDGRYIFYDLLGEVDRAHQQARESLTPQPWQALLQKYAVDYAIVRMPRIDYQWRRKDGLIARISPINLMFPRKSWALSYWDDHSLVLLKREVGFDALIKKEAYPALWPYNLDQMKELLSHKVLSRREVKKELDRHKREVGFSILSVRMRQLLKDLR